MKGHDPKYCKHSGGKYIFSSEAKATRSLNKYEEIKRVYNCPFCNSWHTTSQPANKVEKPPKDISKDIKDRLEYLKDKLNEDERRDSN